VSIFIDTSTRILVQGITGKSGLAHSKLCLNYGSRIVAGVTPCKGGSYVLHKIPVFNTVEEAVRETGATASLIFVPPAFAADSILEAIDGGLEWVVCITEGIPIRDMMLVKRKLWGSRTRLIGPNSPGIIIPGKCKMGIMPDAIFKEGSIGVVSRSGTLMYESVCQLTEYGYGQSVCVGIGGDPIVGTNFIDVLRAFNEDLQTEAIVLIGEIGGSSEEHAADYIRQHVNKPVAAFIGGQTAPIGRRMGHAGAIISGSHGTAISKINALKSAGVEMALHPADIGNALVRALKRP
jgi:succinyl-CoA synthetase alpha subunit